MGIMVPMVQTAEQAAQIASAARYPPAGRRGAAFRVAHDDYSEGDVPDKMRTANEEVMVIAQIETEQGVENVDRIAGTAGVDVIWIGHYDLTCGMGIPGEFQHPRYRRAVDKVLEAGKRHRKAVGFMASSIDEACNLLSEGFRCIAYSLDIAIYQQALKEALGHIRAYERSEWR
jgi:2-dehydro-3-deoxyglucarate aldolase/4-hydroxy-2-oxoheptanedioate aldolase